MPLHNGKYPVVDLFAGPGGLGEGFAGYEDSKGRNVFITAASIERDEHAYNTLLLRHFYRSFRQEEVPDNYYRYLAGEISKDFLIEQHEREWQHASMSALNISLGPENHDLVQKTISKKLGKAKKWVLVGGPPCQAYSLVGRSRRMNDPEFEEDEKHFLYREYLKIITDHKPPVFVMENVKGLLSAKVKGEPVVQKIIRDLSKPKKAVGRSDNGLSYRLYSLSEKGEVKDEISPASFIVKAEEYGVPQARHRMFILGIRSDLDVEPEVLHKEEAPSVKDVIGNMPRIRSGVSKGGDDPERWKGIIKDSRHTEWFQQIAAANKELGQKLQKYTAENTRLPSRRSARKYSAPTAMQEWFEDDRLKVLTGHEARSHMETDLHRYLFAASFSEAFDLSPKLSDFPSGLLPNHKNVEDGRSGKMFSDRFRVQLPSKVSTTVTSHISKDGHYFIHYDPAQCRSLTVREAARLQTFLDNYHFEGPRTAQYHQVGNAVPPYLASQIAGIISDVLDRIPEE